MPDVRWTSVLAALVAGCEGAPSVLDPPTGTWDCAALPSEPLAQEPFGGAVANEDLTFDAEGYLVGADENRSLWRTHRDGDRTLVMPQSGVTAGLRLMGWDGRLASAQYNTNAIYAIDLQTGSRELLVGGLATPSGIEIGLDASIWFGELNGDRVQRYHVPPEPLHVVAEGLLRPNGVSFNETYDRLYVAATDESRIYAIDIDPETLEPIGEPWVLVEEAGTGIDGLSVDACGNIYASWWSKARIDRYSADGSEHEVLVDEGGAPHALGNFAWGAAAQDWPRTTIYAVETGRGTVRAIDLGVGEKPRP